MESGRPVALYEAMAVSMAGLVRGFASVFISEKGWRKEVR
jgi:hypothetical protein